jgi:hypothetical protein
VPLSEHEQRLFEQIERSLAEDPKFASAVRATDPRLHARRRLVIAAFLIVAGLFLVVVGVSTQVLVSVFGFVVMLLAAAYGLTAIVRSRNATELRAVDGTASRATRRPSRGSFIDRLEERWRQRPAGDR